MCFKEAGSRREVYRLGYNSHGGERRLHSAQRDTASEVKDRPLQQAGEEAASLCGIHHSCPEMQSPDAVCGSQELRLLTKAGSCKDGMS